MASNPPPYTYVSPREGYENACPLPNELNEDGKSFRNPPRDCRSKTYEAFPAPLDNGRRGGFDVHIYHFQSNPEQVNHAKDLWECIRRECKNFVSPRLTWRSVDEDIVPELRIYRFWERPVGPHPLAMFEVNIFTPAQFGAFIPWLAIYRGPLSVLIHPNTTEEGFNRNATELRNHTQRAIWMGERLPMDTTVFYRDL